jgi:hypothetical protein
MDGGKKTSWNYSTPIEKCIKEEYLINKFQFIALKGLKHLLRLLVYY